MKGPIPIATPAPDPDVLIRARSLTKTYGKNGSFTAVDGIDFELRRGEAFGFLGPNGAGKSTTMRMIGCVSPRSAGELQILDLDPEQNGPAIRARLGVVPQEDSLDTELTVRENILIYGRYFGASRAQMRKRAAELLEFSQLEEKATATVDSLSGGMRRRLTIARSLVNDPEILLLDEPTTGLDPQARHVLWERLFLLKQQGASLVLTTHYMDEAEQLCDRLVIMDHGRITAEGTPRALIEKHSTREVVELRFAPDRNGKGAAEAQHLVRCGLAERIDALPDRVLVYADDGEAALAEAHKLGPVPIAALVRRSSLEDVFLKLTGRTLAD